MGIMVHIYFLLMGIKTHSQEIAIAIAIATLFKKNNENVPWPM